MSDRNRDTAVLVRHTEKHLSTSQTNIETPQYLSDRQTDISVLVRQTDRHFSTSQGDRETDV